MTISLQDASDVATITTAVIALSALAVAWQQIRSSRSETRLSTARAIYREYLAMAFDHPGVSSASYPVDSPAFYTIQKNSEDFEAYEFYVSHMLFAAETILDLSKNQKKWRNVLKDQLRYHALYIGSETFPRDHYEDDLLTLIDEAIADYQRDAASDAHSPNTM